MSQVNAYLRELQNASAEFLNAYKKLEALEQRRVDVGFTVTQGDVDNFPHLTLDNVANAQNTVAQVKVLMDAGHRSNLNRVIP